MALHTTLPENLTEVDVIIAGGGAAGSLVAGRIAAASPTTSVLLIERGMNNSVPSTSYPSFVFNNLIESTGTLIFHEGAKEEQLGNRPMTIQTGGVLGGGCATNMMMYSRPHPADLDSWNMPGWSTEEMIPFFQKYEHYSEPDLSTHGYNGPIVVSRGPFISKRLEDQLIESAMKRGLSEKPNLQDFSRQLGTARAHKFLTPTGARSDTTIFIHPLLKDGKHPNLNVLIETEVIRVLFDENKKATGVEFRPNPNFRAGNIQTVKARKLVVVSSGAFGSAAILERSGVGAKEVLEKAGVPLVAEVPGVGNGYQDHPLATYPYRTNLNPNETLDELAQGRITPADFISNNDPRLGWNSQDFTAKIRPTEEEAVALGSEFLEAWNRDYKPVPGRPVAILSSVGVLATLSSNIPQGQYFSMSTFTLYPLSRGHTHIISSSIDDAPDFATGFFTNSVDIKFHMWSYKYQREIVRRTPLYRGEVASLHPPFSSNSSAKLVELDAPLSGNVTDIKYTAEDDAVLEKWLRENIGTTWHSLGTCKMAPFSNDGVVDENLSVYGTKHLKVVDLSIVPENVGANTGSVVMAIAEKAASIIGKSLCIKI